MASTRDARTTPTVGTKQFISVPLPDISTNMCTEAFKVNDVKQSAKDFIDQVGGLLRGIRLDTKAIDVSDLRLKTEEEDMFELEEQLRSEAEAAKPSGDNLDTTDGAGPSTENGAVDANGKSNSTRQQQDTEMAEAAVEGDGMEVVVANNAIENIQKAAAQKAFDDLAAQVRQRRRERRDKAAEKLEVLQNAASWEAAAAADPYGAPYETRGRQLKRLQQAIFVPTAGKALVPREEIVLHVAIHVPHAPAHLSEEFLVLGRQPLTVLRDAIYCLTDVNLKAVDDQENAQRAAAHQPAIQLSKPSAYFYIEGTFYNDMRQPGAIDYSAKIRSYLAEHGIEAPPHPAPPAQGQRRNRQSVTEHSARFMQDAKFEDLWLRLGAGAPGLYCHQGGCEHLVVFKDVRLFAPGADPPTLEQYPFRLAASHYLSLYRQCEACTSRDAKRVTYDDMQAPHTPFFWCDECYRMAHYDAEGKSLDTNYKVFPYNHEYNLLTLRAHKENAMRKNRSGAAAAAAAAPSETQEQQQATEAS